LRIDLTADEEARGGMSVTSDYLAEQTPEVAGQLTYLGAKQAVLNLAESYERLARAAVKPTVVRRRELAKQRHEWNS
jgi:hypothetical protein